MNENYFHNKNYALSLAFITRFKATQKWPIKLPLFSEQYAIYYVSSCNPDEPFADNLVYQFSSIQVLVNVIWKLRTSGFPKLAWCKINLEGMNFDTSRTKLRLSSS